MKKFTSKVRGFTLIELLVVIAIIGILASVVLVSLGSARNKGKWASVQASMSSIRAAAELMVDNTGAYPTDICTSATNGVGTLITAVKANSATVRCNFAAASGYAVEASSSPVGSVYCVDSSGYSGSSTALLGSGYACSR